MSSNRYSIDDLPEWIHEHAYNSRHPIDVRRVLKIDSDIQQMISGTWRREDSLTTHQHYDRLLEYAHSAAGLAYVERMSFAEAWRVINEEAREDEENAIEELSSRSSSFEFNNELTDTDSDYDTDTYETDDGDMESQYSGDYDDDSEESMNHFSHRRNAWPEEETLSDAESETY